MKRVLFFVALLLSAQWIYSQEERRLVILHTNDLHSHINGFSPESAYTPLTAGDDNTRGGFARIASLIKSEKAANSCPVMVLDAGDFLMGTLFQSLEPEYGFQLSLMKQMGYDAVGLGNHEFDFGPEKLAQIIRSSLKNGPIPKLFLGNGHFSESDKRDDDLEKLSNEGVLIRTSIIEKDGLRVGIFSLIGKEADDNAAFAPPVTFAKQVPEAKKMVKELRKSGCDIVICLSHSGIRKDEEGNWEGEDVELAEKVDGIDVIISAHSHTRVEDILIVNGVPVVQTGEYGASVGKLALLIQNGNVKVEDYSLIEINDNIPGDKEIDDLIQAQNALIEKKVLTPIGISASDRVAETSYLLECSEYGDVEQSNLGPLVADAIHSYVNRHSESGTDMSMVAAGVIRDKIVPGIQTPADIFKIISMGSGNDNIPGYPLARIYVSGKELKSVLEILNIAWKSTPGNYCYYSGIEVSIDPDKGLLKKIVNIGLVKSDGSIREVDFSKKNKELYSITANSYMLEFIGIIKKMSFGLINVVPKNINGEVITDMKTAHIDISKSQSGLQEGKEWLALIEFLKSMQDIDSDGIPDIDLRYREPLKRVKEISD